MKTLKLLLALVALLAITGCATHLHENPKLMSDGKTVAYEKDTTRAFLMKGAIEKLRSQTREETSTNGVHKYNHSLSADGLQASGDPDTIKAIMDGMANVGEKIANGATSGAVQGAAKAALPIP